MTILDFSPRLLADKESWPDAACPDCGKVRKHPKGGSQICDDCAEDESTVEFLSHEDYLAEKETKKAAERAQSLPKLLERARVPPRYQRFTRASWEARWGPWGTGGDFASEVTRKLLSWDGKEPETWLVLFYGQFGARKTSLSVALLGERLVAGEDGLFLDATDWVRDMQAAFHIKPNDPDGRKTSAEIFEEARDAGVLVIDDLGAVLGQRSGKREEQSWWREELSALIRHREAWIKPTIVNANASDIRDFGKIDQSLVGRMDVELAFMFPPDGPNFRIPT